MGVGGRVAEKLPADAAQITILKSDELGLAQDLLDAFQTLVAVLVILTLGLYALAVFLARGWRREALRAVGVGFFIAGAAALVARSLAGDAVVSSLADNETVEPAVQATWTIGTSLLQEAAGAMVAVGVVIFLGAWLAGPTGGQSPRGTGLPHTCASRATPTGRSRWSRCCCSPGARSPPSAARCRRCS